MKKHLKLTSILLTVLMAIAVFPLTACSGGGDPVSETKIMNVSLNPQVEFILDKDDKVVTVNALNEEGNLVISAEAFANVEGMSAEKAAELFVKVSEESGFIIEGSLGDNDLTISISGDEANATKLYNSVKGEITNYLDTLDIDIEVEKVQAYTEAQLEQLVASVSLHLDQEEIQALDYQALIKELENSRKETEGMYSQELKNTYYAVKAVEMQKAKLDAIKEKAGTIVSMAISTVEQLYLNAANALIDAREALLDESSAYQVALADLRAKKVEYLNYRKELSKLEVEISSTQQQVLDGLETALNGAETALVSAGNLASSSISTAEQALKNTYDTIITSLTDLGVNIDSYVSDIQTKMETAKTELSVTFKTDYGTVILKAESDWETMYAQLTVEPQPN